MKALSHLHAQSAFSFGSGPSSVASLVLRAVEIGTPALALTDTNSVTGIPELVRRCEKAGIQPIGGCEIVLEGGSRLTLLAERERRRGALCAIFPRTQPAGNADLRDAGTPAQINFIRIDEMMRIRDRAPQPDREALHRPAVVMRGFDNAFRKAEVARAIRHFRLLDENAVGRFKRFVHVPEGASRAETRELEAR